MNKQRIVRIAQIEGRSTLNKKRITRFAKLTLTAIAALTFAGYAEARNHPKIIVTRPADLPELARKRGQAMLLHATGDGVELGCVELLVQLRRLLVVRVGPGRCPPAGEQREKTEDGGAPDRHFAGG